MSDGASRGNDDSQRGDEVIQARQGTQQRTNATNAAHGQSAAPTEPQQAPPADPPANTTTTSNRRNNAIFSDTSSEYALGRYQRIRGSRTQVHAFKVFGNVQFIINSRYDPCKGIGRGAYGVVVSAKDVDTDTKVAIKKIPRLFNDLIDAKRILREVKLLRHFNHENIISLRDLLPSHDVTSRPGEPNLNELFLVLDYMDTDLHKIIYSSNQLTDEHIQYFLYQLLRGLKYIHSAKVVHRDLKPSNLLLNANCHLKICDFGLARGLTEHTTMTEYVVTRWYRAPEIMVSSSPYDYKIDVWSAGCIFAELFMRSPIFPGEDYKHQLSLIFSILGAPTASDYACITNEFARQYISTIPARPQNLAATVQAAHRGTVNPLALDLLAKMLVFDPSKRISVDDALKHPYLADMHDPSIEIQCPTSWCHRFENGIQGRNLTRDALTRLFFEEINRYNND